AQNDRIQKSSAYEATVRAPMDSVAANDPIVAQLNGEITALEREYSAKLNVYRPENPDMIALKTRIDKARQARQQATIAAYAQRKEAARQDMLSAESREASMRNAYEQQKREAMKFNANATTWTDLRGQIEGKRTLLDQLTK